MVRKRIFLVLLTAMFVLPAAVFAAEEPNTADDLTSAVDSNDPNEPGVAAGGLFGLPLDELMDMEVISVTRTKGQKVFDSPAAVYVISQEEICRSGHQILPEVFRGVPGVHVGRISANKWAISIRGFSASLNNKLLVLIDGRSIYTVRFGGVDWDMHNIPLELIERIEIVRGPGGSLWGANAYNGVINIITKPASETQGTLLSAGGGSEHQIKSTAIYGGKLKDNDGHYRIYGEFDKFDDFKRSDGSNGVDAWDTAQTGFRMDWSKESSDFTVQGDFNHHRMGAFLPGPFPTPSKVQSYSGNLLGRWTKTFDDESQLSTLLYYDGVDRDGEELREDRHIGNFEFQHNIEIYEGHQFVWGGRCNINADKLGSTRFIQVADPERTLQTISGFFQDSFYIEPDLLEMIIGTKIESNAFTGFEYQPSARLVWTPNDKNAVWGAASRAVRVPTRLEDNAVLPGIPNINPDLDSEELISFELGLRHIFNKDLFVDVAAFANRYDNLIAQNFATDRLENVSNGESRGFEVTTTWQPTDYWKLLANYSFFDIDLHGKREDDEYSFPRNMANLKSFIDINDKLEFNSTLSYADNISTFNVPSILRVDLGLTYRPSNNMEISIWGQNLTESEQGPEMISREQADVLEVQRSIFGKVTWRF